MHFFNSRYKRARRFYGHSIIVHLGGRDREKAAFLHNSSTLESVSNTLTEKDAKKKSGNDQKTLEPTTQGEDRTIAETANLIKYENGTENGSARNAQL